MVIQARYPGKCAKCSGAIVVGSTIEWSKATRKAAHVTCGVSEAPRASALPVTTLTPVLTPVQAYVPEDYGAFPNLAEWLRGTTAFVRGMGGSKAQRLTLRVRFQADSYDYTVKYEEGRRSAIVGRAGSINIETGEARWYGRPAAGHAVFNALRVYETDPAGAAAAYGRLTGRCCFCALPLSDARSLTVGYGAVCAGNWRLPWGDEVVSMVLPGGAQA